MPRRCSPFEDMIEIAVKLPWWGGLLLVLLAYLGFHGLATMQLPQLNSSEGLGQLPARQLLKTLATALQYIVPAAFLIGTVGSAMGRAKRRRLLAAAADAMGSENLSGMSWQEFEMLVGEAFRRRGFRVQETDGGPDGGMDLVLAKDGARHLVQCKHWKSRKVGVKTVRELFGVMNAEGAVSGYLVTSGGFTKEAWSFADGKNLQLMDGSALRKLIQEVQPSASVVAARQPAIRSTSAAPVASLSCPKCGASMVQRVAKQGKKAGQSFWGCSSFPKCRGVRPV